MRIELGMEVKEGKRERENSEGERRKGTPLNSPRILVFPQLPPLYPHI